MVWSQRRRRGGAESEPERRRQSGALTAVERASPPDPGDGFVGSVGVWRGGGDQVVVHVALEPRLLGRRLLLHLEEGEEQKEKKRRNAFVNT